MRFFTTPEMIALERDNLDLMRAGRDRSEAVVRGFAPTTRAVKSLPMLSG
jgi:hypothetical protein